VVLFNFLLIYFANIVSFCVSASEVYYWCLSAINCTGKNMSANLLSALGEADAKMYLCSKDLRLSEHMFSSFSLRFVIHIVLAMCIDNFLLSILPLKV